MEMLSFYSSHLFFTYLCFTLFYFIYFEWSIIFLGWPWVHYVTKHDLEFLPLLPPLPSTGKTGVCATSLGFCDGIRDFIHARWVVYQESYSLSSRMLSQKVRSHIEVRGSPPPSDSCVTFRSEITIVEQRRQKQDRFKQLPGDLLTALRLFREWMHLGKEVVGRWEHKVSL